MKASTAGPALTSIITRRGFFSLDTMSSMLLAPMIFVPAQRKGIRSHFMKAVFCLRGRIVAQVHTESTAKCNKKSGVYKSIIVMKHR